MAAAAAALLCVCAVVMRRTHPFYPKVAWHPHTHSHSGPASTPHPVVPPNLGNPLLAPATTRFADLHKDTTSALGKVAAATEYIPTAFASTPSNAIFLNISDLSDGQLPAATKPLP